MFSRCVLVLLLALAPSCDAVTAVVGPVIGRVETNTARILLEIDTSASITMRLFPAGSLTATAEVTESLIPNRPQIFRFVDLQPGTSYQVVTQGVDIVNSRFRTLTNSPTIADQLKFAFVACNRIWYTENHVTLSQDLWRSLSHKVRSDVPGERIDITFHLGDQVYSDDWKDNDASAPPNEYQQALTILGTDSATFEGKRAQIVALYRGLYHQTWGYHHTRVALANSPNMMIGDDHEMMDDVGDILTHNNTAHADYFIARIGRDLFMQYQWQLMDDVPGVNNVGTSFVPALAGENRRFWVHGAYAFMFIDDRYAKYFTTPNPAGNEDYLTPTQWNEIDTFLGAAGPTANVELLIVMTQIPVVLFAPEATSAIVALAGEQANDLEGVWEWEDQRNEQERLLTTLRNWKNGGAADFRQISLVGGDMHIGGYTLIEYDPNPFPTIGDEYIFQQLVVGPMSGDRMHPAAQFILSGGVNLLGELDGDYEFKHSGWRQRPSMGFIEAEPKLEFKAIVTIERAEQGTDQVLEVVVPDEVQENLNAVGGATGHATTQAQPFLFIGPVVGRVTDTTARVLLEVSSGAPVAITVRLLNPLTNAVIASSNNPGPLSTDQPTVFTFTGLTASTTYVVQVGGVSAIPSKFRTLPTNPTLADKLSFMFIACNKIYYSTRPDADDGGDVWNEVAAKVQNDDEPGTVDVVFHLGDQVYSDDLVGQDRGEQQAYTAAVARLTAAGAGNFESERTFVTNLYRDIYRRTWGYGPTRQALANAPNIMMGDDHEMMDDVGDIASHNVTTSPDYFIARIGRDMFMEYQWQLWEDVAGVGAPNIPLIVDENRAHWTAGEYGFMLVDNRYARYFQPQQNDPTPYLTSTQWTEIDAFLASQAALNVKLMLVMTQIPVVLFNPNLTETIVQAAGDAANDLEGVWEYEQNHVEQIRLLNALRTWQGAQDNTNNRAVTLIGGDMHLGGWSHIKYQNTNIFQQMVVGPVSGSSLPPVANYLLQNAVNLASNLNADWSFEHIGWKQSPNYGLLVAEDQLVWNSVASHVQVDDAGIALLSTTPQPVASAVAAAGIAPSVAAPSGTGGPGTGGGGTPSTTPSTGGGGSVPAVPISLGLNNLPSLFITIGLALLCCCCVSWN